MRILFFTPFSKRNGAEMMLWYLIKNAQVQEFEFAVYSFYAGELLADLPEGVPFFTPPLALPLLSIKDRIINKLYRRKLASQSTDEHIKSIHEKFAPDVWYVNTILCPGVTELAVKLGVPYVVHFHELLILYQHVSYENLANTIQKASLLMGCSRDVCKKLEVMGGKDICLQYECVDIENIKQVTNINDSSISRKALGIDDKKFIWMMSGSIEYRKGTDLVPSIARLVEGDAYILWMGPGSSGYSFYIEQELNYYGITNVIFLGAKSEDYYEYLALADGLLLTSREDPFPLVMIEAATMGKPIVAFNSGGVKDFVKDGMGLVIDSLDINSLVKAMYEVMNNKINFNKNLSISRAAEFDAKVQVEIWQKSMQYFVAKLNSRVKL